MTTRSKVLLLGWDAACWEYLTPLLEAGRLPNLRQLIDTGASGTLQSTMPPWTPTAWASILTGRNPGGHGVFDLISRQNGSYEFLPTNSQSWKGTPLWRYLNAGGQRTGMVNVPYTYPIEPLDGFVAAGFGTATTAPNSVYPPEAMEWVEKQFGADETVVPTHVLRHGEPEEILAAERRHQERQVQIALGLAQEYDIDVLVINLMLLDHANHKLPTMEYVERAIVHCDEDVGRLIDGFKPDSVFLFSDHGSKRVKGKFLLHAWLVDHGYQVQIQRGKAERSDAVNWIMAQWLQEVYGLAGFAQKVVRHLIVRLEDRLPSGMRRRFWEIVERDVPFSRDYVVHDESVDFQATKIFPGSIYSGLLYLNLAGRDPTGVVPWAERDGLVAELRDRLGELEDPDTGSPLFRRVSTSDELYNGHRASFGPDLVLDAYQGNWNIQTSHFTPRVEPSYGRYFVGPQGDFGWHSQEGVFVWSGPAFRAERQGLQGHVMDIAPTLLYALGIPVPEDYEGEVLQQSIRPAFIERQPLRHQPAGVEEGDDPAASYSPSEVDEITDHLRALGYID